MEDLSKYGWAGAVAIFFIKELWIMLKGDRKKLTETLDHLTLAVAELRIHIDYIKADRERLAKVEKDIGHAFKKIRLIDDEADQ